MRENLSAAEMRGMAFCGEAVTDFPIPSVRIFLNSGLEKRSRFGNARRSRFGNARRSRFRNAVRIVIGFKRNQLMTMSIGVPVLGTPGVPISGTDLEQICHFSPLPWNVLHRFLDGIINEIECQIVSKYRV